MNNDFDFYKDSAWTEHFRHVPDYYPEMYMDGFKPHEILFAHSRKMYNEMQERERQKEDALPTNIKITTEIRKK